VFFLLYFICRHTPYNTKTVFNQIKHVFKYTHGRLTLILWKHYVLWNYEYVWSSSPPPPRAALIETATALYANIALVTSPSDNGEWEGGREFTVHCHDWSPEERDFVVYCRRERFRSQQKHANSMQQTSRDVNKPFNFFKSPARFIEPLSSVDIWTTPALVPVASQMDPVHSLSV
jgi:hypothetical protein